MERLDEIRAAFRGTVLSPTGCNGTIRVEDERGVVVGEMVFGAARRRWEII